MAAEDVMGVLELTRAVTAAKLSMNVPLEMTPLVQAEAPVSTIHRMELLLPLSPRHSTSSDRMTMVYTHNS
jgi:hypothetical protein